MQKDRTQESESKNKRESKRNLPGLLAARRVLCGLPLKFSSRLEGIREGKRQIEVGGPRVLA